jgi:hypothetical protein
MRNVDRAAEDKAKIVVAQRGTGESLEVIKEVVGGEKVVAEKFVGAAMEGIGSRAGDYVDLTSRPAPELGIVVAAQNLEFSNGIDTGKSQQGLVGAAVDVVGTVESPFILTIARTVY